MPGHKLGIDRALIKMYTDSVEKGGCESDGLFFLLSHRESEVAYGWKG